VLILLPGLSWMFLNLALAAYFSRQANSTSHDWRYLTVLAFTCIGFCAVVIIELLNLFSLVALTGVSLGWGMVLSFILFFWFYHGKDSRPNVLISSGFPQFLWPFSIGIGAVVVMVGLVAILSPPNTWDSLTYHMSRVAHWIQNQSVQHYPTNILRQLYHAPGNEFMVLHAQILSGGDRFANLVQWAFYIGCILGTSLIAKQIGSDIWGQLLAAIFSATIPMAILQASSTQSDIAVSFWLIATVVFLLRLQNYFNWLDACAAGVSLGLAFLTKALAYVYVLPFVVWFLWSYFKRKDGLSGLMKTTFVVVVLSLLINAGHLSRNIGLFQHPLGPLQTINLTNEEFGIRPMLSNVIRGAASHASFPIVEINHELTKYVYVVHRWLGSDANNPKTTYAPDFGRFQIRPLHAHEDSSSNPIHFWLILISCMIYLSSKRMRENLNLFRFTMSVLTAFLLLCTIFKWQVWISRLQLPLFFLWAPAVGCVLSAFKQKWMTGILAAALLVTSLYWALFNFSRSLLRWPFRDDLPPTIFESTRDLLYLNNGSKLVRLSYLLAVKYIQDRNYKNLGLLISEDDWEYPYWAMLLPGRQSVRIEHLEVGNVSSRIKRKAFIPDVVVATNPSEVQIQHYEREVGPLRKLGILWVFGK